MDIEKQLIEIFETGMINGVFYSERYISVFQSFLYFSQSGLTDKDLARLYKTQTYPGIKNIPRIIAMWLIENKRAFAKTLYSEIKCFEDMLTFCIPIYHPDLVVMLDKNREEVILDWFAEHLTPGLAIKYFNECKSIFNQLNFEYKKKYPGYIESLCLSFKNETADKNYLYEIAQNVQDRIMERGYIEFDDVKEITENGLPYYWMGTLMTKLDEPNLELFIKACIDTLDENIITEYMKYFYKTNNTEMIELLSQKSFEIKERDVVAFSNVKKYEIDFKYYDVVLDISDSSKESISRFEYVGSHIDEWKNEPNDRGYNPFTDYVKEGSWLLITSGFTNLETFELNISMNPNTDLTIWIMENQEYTPKYMNIKYVIGNDFESIKQIKRICNVNGR